MRSARHCRAMPMCARAPAVVSPGLSPALPSLIGRKPNVSCSRVRVTGPSNHRRPIQSRRRRICQQSLGRVSPHTPAGASMDSHGHGSASYEIRRRPERSDIVRSWNAVGLGRKSSLVCPAVAETVVCQRTRADRQTHSMDHRVFSECDRVTCRHAPRPGSLRTRGGLSLPPLGPRPTAVTAREAEAAPVPPAPVRRRSGSR